MKVVLDLAQTSTFIVAGSALIYSVLLTKRALADFSSAAKRCRRDLAAEEAANQPDREDR
jgi:hypothetical protein